MINKRKPAQPMRPPPQAPQPQVNRCQETAALDQLREEEDDVETPLPSTGQKRHQGFFILLFASIIHLLALSISFTPPPLASSIAFSPRLNDG
jgi:hypothetical protein